MADIVENLLDLQDLDIKIATMERESTDIPTRKADICKQLDSYKANIAESEEQIKGEQLSLKSIEGDIEDGRKKIAKFREQQMSLKTNEEFRAMEHQILGVENEIVRLEDTQLSKYDEIEVVNAATKAHIEKLKEQEDRISSELNELDSRKTHIESEIESIRAGRESAASAVDETWLQRYNQIMGGKKTSAFVPIERNCVCGGCHMQLPPQLRQDAKKREDIVSCNYCGRMLYVDMD